MSSGVHYWEYYLDAPCFSQITAIYLKVFRSVHLWVSNHHISWKWPDGHLHNSSTYGLESDMPYWVHPMISPILLLSSLPGTHAECLECSSSIPACPTTPQYSWACRRDGDWWTWTDHKPVEEQNWLSERCEIIKSNYCKWMFVNNEPLPLHYSFTLSHRYLLCWYAPVYWDTRLQ